MGSLDPAIPPYRTAVREDWVDYNGHLRDAYYLLIFSEATDALMDWIGLDAAGRARTHGSIYTLESHLSYLREVKGGAAVSVETLLVAHDAKRLHVCQTLAVEGLDEPACVCEQMLLHVDTRGPRAAPFDERLLEKIGALAAAHAGLQRPLQLGRRVSLAR